MFQILPRLPESSAWERTPVSSSGTRLSLMEDSQSLVKHEEVLFLIIVSVLYKLQQNCTITEAKRLDVSFASFRLCGGEEEEEELQVDEVEL